MRKISAHHIFCGNGDTIKFGVIGLEGEKIVSMSGSSNTLVETAKTEFYPGVIIPAIVNVIATCDDSIWHPQNDSEIEDMLQNTEVQPLFAVITPLTVNHISSKALQAIINKPIMLALGSHNDNHPVTLFRLMLKLVEHLPNISFAEVVKIATANGAAAMELKKRGSIELHKEPGIYNISGFNFSKMTIDQNSKISILIA